MGLGIIGCGTIAAVYLQALTRLEDTCRVAALYDLHPQKAQALALPGVRLCRSLEEMLCCPGVDRVVISTPLHTHTRIARACLEHKKHVLLEKPATLSPEELEELFALAERQGVIFRVAFHAAFALDLEWYLRELGSTDPVYGIPRLREIECGFFDPYMPDGRVIEDRKALGGSYIDSGVNSLSVCSRLVPLERMALESHSTRQTEEGIVYASRTEFSDGCVRITLHTGWDGPVSKKYTRLGFEGTDTVLLLEHTDQSVWLLDPAGQRQLLYRHSQTERLVNQYIGVFREFAAVTEKPGTQTHRRQADQVHRLLLCAREAAPGREKEKQK